MEADRVAVVRRALRLRLPQTDSRAGPAEVPDRLAPLALDLADPVVAERRKELAVEGQAALDRRDDQVDVVDAGRAHGTGSASRSARPGELLRAAVAHRALHGARVEPALEQLLPQLAFARQAQEEPC